MPGGIPGSGSVSTPIYWDRGEAQFMYDVDGNRYLDLAAGQGSLILGNSLPEVRDAICAQAQSSYYVQIPVPAVVELAELLCARFPAADRVRFVESGTKAANLAVRLGRAFSGREKCATFIGGYHGIWDGALVRPPLRYSGGVIPVDALPGVPRSATRESVLLPWNELERCLEIVESQASEIGTLIMEPVIGDGYVPPRPGFLQAIREACDRHGIVLVFDEAITQSLAPGGAQEHFGVVPDLTTLAKAAIGGGLPIAAVGGRAEIMELTSPLSDGPQVPYGSTFASHALTVAAGLAQVKLLTADKYRRLHELGDRLRAGVAEIRERTGRHELSATGIGNLTHLHWNARVPSTYAEHLECDGAVIGRLLAALLDAGYITAGGGRLHVTAAMTDDDIDGFVADLEAIVRRDLAG